MTSPRRTWLKRLLEPSAEEPSVDQPDPDQAWKALSLVNDWIRHAEAKAGVVLASAGVTGGVLYNLVKTIHHPSCWISALAVLCGILTFAAGGCSAATVVPRRRVSGRPVDFSNLLFYSHVASKYRDDEPTYVEVLSALTSNPAELTRHIANQVHANSIVAHRKFNWTSRGVIALVGALAMLGALALLIGAAHSG